MVFVYSPNGKPAGTGLVASRDTGKYIYLLCIESIVGLTVVLSNLLLIFILAMGGRRFMKNHFYIVLANLLVCTSLKGFVELAFILPYYIRQGSATAQAFGYFSQQYEFVMFNVSVLADYGVLFFSVLIATNRYLAVASNSSSSNQTHVKTALSCAFVWMCTVIIPLLFYFFECQYVYENLLQIYYYKCLNAKDELLILLSCLINLSYLCAVMVFITYVLIFIKLRRQRNRMSQRHKSARSSSTQMRLLKQSVIVFVLYAASILCVFVISFLGGTKMFSAFDISYAENLLNLSIAAVYPICFLTMSGEMKNVLLSKVVPRSSDRVSSIGSNPNN